MTLDSNVSPRMRVSFFRPCSTCLRMSGVMSYCLPVYSTFIELPLLNRTDHPQSRPLGSGSHLNVLAALAGAFPPPWVAQLPVCATGFFAVPPMRPVASRENRGELSSLSVEWRECSSSQQRRQLAKLLVLHPTLMRAGNLHILPVLRNRPASDLDTLRLKDAGDLLVR